MDLSNKEVIVELGKKIKQIADPYRSLFVREKTLKRLAREEIHTDGTRADFEKLDLSEEELDPHITLGEIDFDEPQADIAESQINLAALKSKKITVSGVTIFWYGKENDDEKAHLIEEVVVPFNQS